MQFVADCSVTLAWYLEDETTDYTEMLLDSLVQSQIIVPILWRLEFANALLMAMRRKRIDDARRKEIISQAERLPIEVDMRPVGLAEISDLAVECELTAYDAAYLEVAHRRSLPLATLDKALIKAAKKKNVLLLR